MTTARGIDVSRWQSAYVPTGEVAAFIDLTGLDFLFARASIGTRVDPLYDGHIARARRAGLITGAYHFNWDTISVAAQVKAFLAAAGDVDFYFIDVEGGNAFSQAQTHEFLRLMHVAGKKCGLYHSASGYFDVGQDYDWVAKWGSTPPSGDWEFWQYTSDGHLPGYSGRLDLNRFNGTRADLLALAGRLAPDTDIETTGDSSMKLTAVSAVSGTATLSADGPVWNVATGARVNASKGTDWRVVGKCHYDSPGEDGTSKSPGYLIAANAADQELHVVAQTRVTFVPTPAPVCPPATDCTPAIEAVTKALRLQLGALGSANDALEDQLVAANQALVTARLDGARAEYDRQAAGAFASVHLLDRP